jgi:hypothetical protein
MLSEECVMFRTCPGKRPDTLTLDNQWQFFRGYRFGIFTYATQALGGAVTVRRFDLTTP